MPIREYTCSDCEKNHDTLVRTIEDYPIRCPHCGSEKLSPVITAIGGIQGHFGTVPKKGSGSFKRSK